MFFSFNIWFFFLISFYFSENCNQVITGEKPKNNKIRRRTTQTQELLFGINPGNESPKVEDQNQNHNHPLTRVPSAPGSLK